MRQAVDRYRYSSTFAECCSKKKAMQCFSLLRIRRRWILQCASGKGGNVDIICTVIDSCESRTPTFSPENLVKFQRQYWNNLQEPDSFTIWLYFWSVAKYIVGSLHVFDQRIHGRSSKMVLISAIGLPWKMHSLLGKIACTALNKMLKTNIRVIPWKLMLHLDIFFRLF